MLSVGPLTADDRPVWEQLFRAYVSFYERDEPDAMYARAWTEFHSGERIHALGARLDGRLVGIAHFLTHASTSSRDVCYLQDLYTDAAERGQGVGRALIEAVAQWARTQDCARLYWQTRTTNALARALYDQVARDTGFMVYLIPL